MVFGQITPKLSMFWVASMLMRVMRYMGILGIKFWTAGPGIADAVVAYWDVPCTRAFVVSVLPACSVQLLPLCEVVPCVRVCGPPDFQNAFFHFLPIKLQLFYHLELSRFFRLPAHFNVLSAFLHMWQQRLDFWVFLKSQWLTYSRTLWKNECTILFQATSLSHLY